jgi:hypothetical protein
MSRGRARTNASPPRTPKPRESFWSRVIAPRDPFVEKMSRAQLKEALEGWPLVDIRWLGDATLNDAAVVTVQGPDGTRLRGLFKKGKIKGLLTRGFPMPFEKQYLREIGLSALAAKWGLADVPLVVGRTVGDHVGSLMVFIEGGKASSDFYGDHTLVRDQAEKLFLFDFIVGSGDRSRFNIFVQAKERGELGTVPSGPNALGEMAGESVGTVWTAALIDLGIALPLKGEGTLFDWPKWTSTWKGPVLSSTRRWLAGLDGPAAARLLKKHGIEREAIVLFLRRLEAVQKNTLPFDGPDRNEAARRMLKDETQGLPQATLDRIDALVRELFVSEAPDAFDP